MNEESKHDGEWHGDERAISKSMGSGLKLRASTVGDGNCKDNVHGNGTLKDKFRARR